MKKRTTTTLVLAFIGLLWAGLAAAQSGDADSSQSSADYDQALTFYQQGQFDEAIKKLQGPSAANPYDLKINSLLAKAYLDKAEKMKIAGDKGYRYSIKQPYVIGIRLLRANPTLPGPYYIIAKSLLINNRPLKAARSIEKAIYYAGPQHKDYATYLETKGDCWKDLMVKRKDMRGFGYAKKSYEMALAAAKDDAGTVTRIKLKIMELEKKHRRS